MSHCAQMQPHHVLQTDVAVGKKPGDYAVRLAVGRERVDRLLCGVAWLLLTAEELGEVDAHMEVIVPSRQLHRSSGYHKCVLWWRGDGGVEQEVEYRVRGVWVLGDARERALAVRS